VGVRVPPRAPHKAALAEKAATPVAQADFLNFLE